MVFSTIVAFTNQIEMFCLLGRPLTKIVYDNAYGGVSLVLLLTFVSFTIVLYMRGSHEYRAKVRLMMWLIISSVVLAMLRGMDAVYPSMSSVQPWGAHRYFFMGCWCFAFLILLATEYFKPAWPEWEHGTLAVAIFLLGGIGNFRLAPHAITDWKKHAPEVEAWQADRKAGREHPEVIIPISPAGWAIHLPKLQSAIRDKYAC